MRGTLGINKLVLESLLLYFECPSSDKISENFIQQILWKFYIFAFWGPKTLHSLKS